MFLTEATIQQNDWSGTTEVVLHHAAWTKPTINHHYKITKLQIFHKQLSDRLRILGYFFKPPDLCITVIPLFLHDFIQVSFNYQIWNNLLT